MQYTYFARSTGGLKRPPRPSPPCLEHPTPPNKKGGTLIAVDVGSFADHKRRLCNPNGYRPLFCPRCGKTKLHVHDYRERKLKGDSSVPTIRIIRFRCFECEAIWRILPAFVARCLWRSWQVVENETIAQAPPKGRVRVPLRTVQRWRARLLTDAATLIIFIRHSDRFGQESTIENSLEGSSRRAFIDWFANTEKLAPGTWLSAPAAFIHQRAPHLRLL